MKKIVRETIIEGVADKFAQQDPYLRTVPDEFADFEKSYSEEKQKGDVFFKKENLTLIKNPQDLSNFGKGVRGVILPSGDLFIELTQVSIHNDILNVLKEKNLIPQETKKNWGGLLPSQTKFLTVQRVNDTNTIAIGESNRIIYDIENYKKYINIYDDFLKKAKAKCKNIGFINKLIGTKNPETTSSDHIVNKSEN